MHVNLLGKVMPQGKVEPDDADLVSLIRTTIAQYGYCYLASPHSVDDYERLAANIGSVELRMDIRIDKQLDSCQRQTRAGNGAKRPGAYRAEGLSLHSDRPTVDVLGFYCQTQDILDGTLMLVDTRRINLWFSETELEKLAQVRIQFTTRDQQTGIERLELQSVVLKEFDYYHIYYAPWFFPETPAADVEKLLKKLTAFVINQQNKATIPIRLKSGESVFLDNKRMLHGRGPIAPDSKRHLVRLYLVTA